VLFVLLGVFMNRVTIYSIKNSKALRRGPKIPKKKTLKRHYQKQNLTIKKHNYFQKKKQNYE
jgi:hypothetical protein